MKLIWHLGLLGILVIIGSILSSGCSGSSDFFEALVPDGSKERYIESGATGLHIYDVNAGLSATTTPEVLDSVVSFPLYQGCTMSWDIRGIDPIDYEFWGLQPLTITYDLNLFSCGRSYECHYDGGINPAVLNGSIYEVPVMCEEVL